MLKCASYYLTQGFTSFILVQQIIQCLYEKNVVQRNKTNCMGKFSKFKYVHWTKYFLSVHALCHGPAGVPRLATRCLCVLSTWLVVCLVPCAPMSIVCPLPSCYLIIVSVAPAVSPSLPSFVSLYSLLVSAVLCWSVVFHVSYVTWVFHVDCAPVLCLPACLPACFFPFGVVFVLLCFVLFYY